MSCGLGVLVYTRRLLHQSRPSIEGMDPNTAIGSVNANAVQHGQQRRTPDLRNLVDLPKSPVRRHPNSAVAAQQPPCSVRLCSLGVSRCGAPTADFANAAAASALSRVAPVMRSLQILPAENQRRRRPQLPRAYPHLLQTRLKSIQHGRYGGPAPDLAESELSPSRRDRYVSGAATTSSTWALSA
jgi:hypothetical protein